MDGLLNEFKEVFTTELGTMSNVQVKLKVKEGIEPKFYRARPVPYILKPAIEGELIRLVEQGVYKPVAYSAWAAPIVPVKKDNGGLEFVEITVSLPIVPQSMKTVHCQKQKTCWQHSMVEKNSANWI